MPKHSIEDLNRQFSKPGVKFESGNGGLTQISISTRAAVGEIYLHGAHVTGWNPAGTAPVLFMSGDSLFDAAKPIRGGVPVIFPWFGPRAGHAEHPMHGFARTSEWEVQSVEVGAQNQVDVVLSLPRTTAAQGLFPQPFEARFIASFGQTLSMTLEVRNTGEKPLQFEEALHTYFTLGDVKSSSVSGLAGVTYIDKVDQFARKVQDSAPIRITGETDRVYLATDATCVIDDPAQDRRIEVGKSGSGSTVVWNPWIAKAKGMADFGDEEWQRMICVETANAADDAVTLAPGKTHAMTARVRVLKS